MDNSNLGRVLLVDDDASLLRAIKRLLVQAGYAVVTASDGNEAVAALGQSAFDAVVSDVSMPGLTGVELLRAVRELDADLPVLLATGSPSMQTAMEAIEMGAARYFEKPVETPRLLDAVAQAVARFANARRMRAAMVKVSQVDDADRSLQSSFDGALEQLFMVYQPIVAADGGQVYAYEALARTSEATLPTIGDVLDAARRLGRLGDLGRRIWAEVAAALDERADLRNVFVNLHPADLLDDALYSVENPLRRHAARVVLEITERSSLEHIADVRARVARLREIGFRIAVDDLGAGYSGLTSFVEIEPEVLKVDMSLVRDVDRHGTKQRLIRVLTTLAKETGTLVVAEGVETAGERDMLIELGCGLLQGYLFAKPARL